MLGAKLLSLVEVFAGSGFAPTWYGFRYGYSFVGGLVLGVATGYTYLRLSIRDPLVFADAVSPSVALGFAVAKVGCYLNGCCSAASYMQSLFPLQLALSLAGCVVYAGLAWMSQRALLRGRAFGVFLAAMGAFRLALYAVWDSGSDKTLLLTPGATSAIMVAAGLLWIGTVKPRVHGASDSSRCSLAKSPGRPAIVLLFLAWVVARPAGLHGSARWARVIGGAHTEAVAYLAEKSGGGYLTVGTIRDSVTGSRDAWLANLDAVGNTVWVKRIGGASDDMIACAHATGDGGLVCAGETSSFGAGGRDAWVFKIDADGKPVWQMAYGGASTDNAMAIDETTDGGYVVVGYTYPSHPFIPDAWCIRLDPSGRILWQNTYGGLGGDFLTSVQQTRDGGFVAAGITYSFGAGYYDAWVLKLGTVGQVLWQKTYGGPWLDYCQSILETTDGSFLFAGETQPSALGDPVAWVVKLGCHGEIIWQKTLGSNARSSIANSAVETSDGSYLVVGGYSPSDLDMSNGWAARLSPGGRVRWQRSFTAGDVNYFKTASVTGNGGYAIGGATAASDWRDGNAFLLVVSGQGRIRSTCEGVLYSASHLVITDSCWSASRSAAISAPDSVRATLTKAATRDMWPKNKVLCQSQ